LWQVAGVVVADAARRNDALSHIRMIDDKAWGVRRRRRAAAR
jgi:hypothetical protein